MLKFTIFEGKLTLSPSMIMIEEFTNILEKAKSKEHAFKLLLYVYYCCDLSDENPMRDIDHREKEAQALKRAMGKDFKKFNAKELALLGPAMDAYNYLNETPIERATLSFDMKIDQIRTFLDNTVPEMERVLDEDGALEKFVSNDKIISGFSKQLVDLTTYKLTAMNAAKKMEAAGRVRGGKGSSMIERGTFRDDDKT